MWVHRVSRAMLWAMGGCLTLAMCSRPKVGSLAELPPPEGLVVRAPDMIRAGDELVFDIEMEAAPGVPWLVLTSPWGDAKAEVSANVDGYTTHIPKAITRLAGKLQWRLGAGSATWAKGSIEVLPAEDLPEVLESYASPSHIRLGTEAFADFVVLPVDVWDNPLPEGTELGLFRDAFGETEGSLERLKHLIAYQRNAPLNGVGKIYMHAVFEGRSSQRREIEVLPGKAQAVPLNYDRPHAYADGNSLLRLEAGPLRDSLGYPVPDGTWVEFRIMDAQGGLRVVPGYSLRGIAAVSLRYPSKATSWQLSVQVTGGADARLGPIDFLPAITTCTLTVLDKGRLLRFGPVYSEAGGLAPDGIPVTATLSAGESMPGKTYQSLMRGGRADIRIPETEIPPGTYTLRVQCGDWKQETTLQIGVP